MRAIPSGDKVPETVRVLSYTWLPVNGEGGVWTCTLTQADIVSRFVKAKLRSMKRQALKNEKRQKQIIDIESWDNLHAKLG